MSQARSNKFTVTAVAFFEGVASRIEQYWFLALFLLTLLYAGIVLRGSHAKFIDHDELFVYYIASAPSFHQMMHEVLTIDLNPPLQYILTRISVHLFGSGDLALRAPSIAGFFLAWLMLFLYTRRRFSTSWAVAAVLLFWSTEALPFAWEGRPYALLLGLASTLAFCWSFGTPAAPGEARRPLWVAPSIFIVGLGLFSTHMFAPFAFLPFLVAQGVRSYRTRKLDWPLLLALMAPSVVFLVNMHLLKRIGNYVYPTAVLAKPVSAIRFYASYAQSVSLDLALLLLIALLWSSTNRFPATATDTASSRLPIEDWVLWLGLSLAPIGVIAALMIESVSIGNRYLLIGTLGLSMTVIAILFRGVHGARTIAAMAATAFLLALPLALNRDAKDQTFDLRAGFIPLATTVNLLEPNLNLPVVAAHADTFIDINQREEATFSSRVSFLMSRADAVQYRHLTLYEEELNHVNGVFPLRDHVVNYQDFVAEHPRFILLSTPQTDPYDSMEWIVPKLLDEHATIRLLGPATGSYMDSMLYEVTMPTQR